MQDNLKGDGETKLKKKIAILAVAVAWICGPALGGAAPASPKAAVNLTTRRRRAIVKRRYRPVRRPIRYWSPWHVSSYGDPTAYDDPAGEDLAIRQAAVAALGKWNGAIVVVDPNTGRILSIVNQKLALGSGFIPCSTFKPIVALAALKRGVITPQTRIWVGPRWSVSLSYALAHSINGYFFKVGQMVGFPTLERYAHEFGLGQKAGWDIPGESPGVFPSAPPADGVGNLAYIGEGMQVTMLQMAAVISAIANGGTLYYLQYPRTPEQVRDFVPRVRRRLTNIIPYLPAVKAGMAGAVGYGTARLAYDRTDPILGKTGTCSQDGARLGWFDSYRADAPRYVVITLLRGGRPMYGPHAAEIAGRLYRDLQHISIPRAEATRAENTTADPTARR
jgi:penicillin-binding protein 2